MKFRCYEIKFIKSAYKKIVTLGVMSEGLPQHQNPMEMDRRAFISGLAAVAAGAIGVASAKAWGIFHPPEIRSSGPAEPKSKPLPPDFYEPMKELTEPVETLHSQASHERFAQLCDEADSVEELEALAGTLVESFDSTFKIGQTDVLDEWMEFARELGVLKYGRDIPKEFIDVQYGTPTIEDTRAALKQISDNFGVVPRIIFQRTKLKEHTIVDRLAIVGRLPHIREERFRMNGAADTKRGNIVETVNNQHTGNLRPVGFGLLERDGALIDRTNVGTEDTFDDIAYLRLEWPTTPESELRAYLDSPRNYADSVERVADSKSRRIVEILRGDLIIPGDEEFDSLQQKQQYMMLERLQETYGVEILDHCRQARIARDRLGRTPRFQEELYAA